MDGSTSGERPGLGAAINFQQRGFKSLLADPGHCGIEWRGRRHEKVHRRQAQFTANQCAQVDRRRDQDAGPTGRGQRLGNIGRIEGLGRLQHRPTAQGQQDTELEAIHVLRGNRGEDSHSRHAPQKGVDQPGACAERAPGFDMRLRDTRTARGEPDHCRLLRF